MTNDPPVLVILGGINGAGKSSAVRVMAQAAILAPAIFLDPDKVTAEILAKRPDLDPAAANFAGLHFVSQEINRLLGARQSFMTGTVLANNAYRRICLDAKDRGWTVRLLYGACRRSRIPSPASHCVSPKAATTFRKPTSAAADRARTRTSRGSRSTRMRWTCSPTPGMRSRSWWRRPAPAGWLCSTPTRCPRSRRRYGR